VSRLTYTSWSWSTLRKATAPKRRPIAEPSLETQVRQFIAHIDVLAERLTPQRRPQDRDEPECSRQELRALAALGRQGTLGMSDLAAILKVPLSTATRTIDKLVAKDLVERQRVKQDRRIVQVTFSRRGKRIHQFVLKSQLATGRSLLEPLSSRERELFLQRMTIITGGKAGT
jgi:DNA-binding MarR family transcriptional regulator